MTEQAFPDDQAPAQAYLTCNKPSIVSGRLRVQEYIRQDKEWATIGHDTVKADHTPTPFLAYGACATGPSHPGNAELDRSDAYGGIGPRADTTDPDACR